MAHQRAHRSSLAGRATTAAVLAGAIFAGQAGADGACSSSACRASLTVGAETVSFATPERFYPSEQNVSVRLTAADERLRATRTIRDCETHYAGPGIRAVVSACLEGAPIRLSARRVWGGTVSLRMTYRALSRIPQEVQGIQAGSGGAGGSGAGPPRGGGIGPA